MDIQEAGKAVVAVVKVECDNILHESVYLLDRKKRSDLINVKQEKPQVLLTIWMKDMEVSKMIPQGIGQSDKAL